jgi:hypothetical protein
MKILLGDFNAEVDREDIFKPTIKNESLHEISNNYGVRVVNSYRPSSLLAQGSFLLTLRNRKTHLFTLTLLTWPPQL